MIEMILIILIVVSYYIGRNKGVKDQTRFVNTHHERLYRKRAVLEEERLEELENELKQNPNNTDLIEMVYRQRGILLVYMNILQEYEEFNEATDFGVNQ